MAARSLEMLVTIVTRFASKAVNFVVFAILTRTLATSDLGIYGFVFTTSIIFASFFDVGTRNSVAKFIGAEADRKSDYALQSLVLFVPFAFIAVAVVPMFFAAQALEITLSAVLIPALLNIVSLLFIRMQQGVLLGVGDIKFFNKTELASRIVLLIGTFAVIIAYEINLMTALYVLALSNFAGAVAVAVGTIPVAKGGRLGDLSPMVRLVRRGFLFMLSVVAMLVAKQLAFLIISQLGSGGQTGLFYGARRLTDILTEIGLAVSVVLFSHNVRNASREDALRDTAKSTRLSFAFFVVLTIIALIVARPFLPLALGPSFEGYETLFRILMVGTLVGTIWVILFPSLSAVDTPMVALLIFLPNLAFGTLVTWVTYTNWGLNGAAVGMSLTQLTLSATFLVVFKRRYGVAIRDFLIPKPSDLAAIRAKLKRKGGKG